MGVKCTILGSPRVLISPFAFPCGSYIIVLYVVEAIVLSFVAILLDFSFGLGSSSGGARFRVLLVKLGWCFEAEGDTVLLCALAHLGVLEVCGVVSEACEEAIGALKL